MQKKLIYTLLLILAWPASALSAVSPDQLDAIMGDAPVSQPKPANIDALLDKQAEMVTKALGKNDPAWTNTNPKWAVVYTKVRADLAADNKPVMDYLQQAAEDSKKNIAENLEPADVKSITDFLNTDEGKRYQVFDKQADAIVRDGMRALMGHTPPPPKTPLSKEQIDHYTRMLMQAKSVQTQMAMVKTATSSSGVGGAMGFALGFAIQARSADVEKLYQQYGPDIDKFDAFNQSDAQQHFLRATVLSAQQVIKKMKEIEAAQTPIKKKQQEEWAALYQRQMANGK